MNAERLNEIENRVKEVLDYDFNDPCSAVAKDAVMMNELLYEIRFLNAQLGAMEDTEVRVDSKILEERNLYRAALQQIIELAVDGEPTLEDYEDAEDEIELHFSFGVDRGRWNAAQIAREALKEVQG